MSIPNAARVLTVEPGESVAATLGRLRTESFDAIVATYGPAYDALVLARALRGAGDETPLAIVGADDADARAAGADFGVANGGDLDQRLAAAITAHAVQRATRFALVAEQQRSGSELASLDCVAAEHHEQLATLRDVAGPDVRRYLAAEPPASETPARAA